MKRGRVATVLTVRTPLPVRWLNCGNDHVLAVIRLIVAAAAFVVARRALYRDPRARTLHRSAQRASPVSADGSRDARRREQRPEIQPGVSSVMARLEIGWENKGEKAVGPTTMEVLVPGSIPEFGWTDQWRGAIRFWTGSDFAAPPATRRGGETPAQCVSTEIPRRRLRTLTLR